LTFVPTLKDTPQYFIHFIIKKSIFIMKNALLFFCLMAISTQITAQTPSVNSEEEAVKKVIIDEMDAYITSNLEAWANAQMQTPYHSTLHKFVNVSSNVGWEKKYADAKKGFGTPNDVAYKKSYSKVNRTDWNIQIRGNVAWARWKDTWDMVNGSVLPMYNLKILEKQNNQWRIAHAGVYTAPEETFNQAKEEEAIKNVIVSETEMWLDQKKDAWAESFIHEPHLTWTVTNGGEPGDVLTMRGWDALNTYMDKWFGNDMSALTKEWRKAKTTRDQWSIQIRGNVAYVSFNQRGEGEKQKMDSTETRVLEKINGKWKIVMSSTLADFKDATPPIRSKY
jgi:hypothetical protein